MLLHLRYSLVNEIYAHQFEQSHILRLILEIKSMFIKGTNYKFFAPAKTLSQVLNSRGISIVDLLCIDIEGYELEALKGINFDSFLIKYIVIESRKIDDIKNYLFEKDYFLKKQLTHHDYLFCKNKI